MGKFLSIENVCMSHDDITAHGNLMSNKFFLMDVFSAITKCDNVVWWCVVVCVRVFACVC